MTYGFLKATWISGNTCDIIRKICFIDRKDKEYMQLGKCNLPDLSLEVSQVLVSPEIFQEKYFVVYQQTKYLYIRNRYLFPLVE